MFRNFHCVKVGADQVKVFGRCRFTGKPVVMVVRMEAIVDYYERGKYVQDAFHDLTPGQREFFVSGTSEEGWNKRFPPP